MNYKLTIKGKVNGKRLKQIKLFETRGDALDALKSVSELMRETYPEWDERYLYSSGRVEEFSIVDGDDPDNNRITTNVSGTIIPMWIERFL